MKKKLLALLSLIMACMMLFVFASCDKDDDDDGKDDETGVAVGDAVSEMLKATLAENGIKATLKMDATIPEEGDMTMDCQIFVAKDSKGEYDIKIVYDGEMDGDKESGTVIVKDGKGYMSGTTSDWEYDEDLGMSVETAERPYYSYEDLYEGAPEGFILSLDYLLNNDAIYEEMIGMTKAELQSILSEYKIELSTDGIANLVKRVVNALTLDMTFTKVDGGYEISYSMDMKDQTNQMLDYLGTVTTDTKISAIFNKLYDIVGVDMTADKVADILEDALKDDMTVTEAVASLEKALKELTGEEISFKAIIDEMQTDLDISTQQIIDLVKMAAGGDMDGQLTDAKSGETAYDYIMGKFGEIVLSEDMIGMKLSDLAVYAGTFIKTATLGDVITTFADEEVTEDDFASINETLAMMGTAEYEKYNMSFKFRLDSNYRLEEISMSMNMKIPDNFIDAEETWIEIGNDYVDEDGYSWTYDVTPEEVLKNGYTVDLVMGSKASVKDVIVEIYYDEEIDIDGVKVENGKVVIDASVFEALNNINGYDYENHWDFGVIVIAADGAKVELDFYGGDYVE